MVELRFVPQSLQGWGLAISVLTGLVWIGASLRASRRHEHENPNTRGDQRRCEVVHRQGGVVPSREWMNSKVPPRGSENSTVMRFTTTL